MDEADASILRAAVAIWRKRVEPYGSAHPLWDQIFDAEAILRGGEHILSEEEIMISAREEVERIKGDDDSR